MKLHPITTIFSMIIGIAIYGLIGVVLGPLILVVLREIFDEFVVDRMIRRMISELLARSNYTQKKTRKS